MRRLLLHRLALVVPTLFGVALLVFLFLHLVPGDPVEIMLGESATPADIAALRHALGLDRPLPVQFVRLDGALAHGDLGESIAFRAPVAQVIAQRYPATLELACTALVLALAIALPLGVASAVRRDTAVDHAARVASLVGTCVPAFWLGSAAGARVLGPARVAAGVGPWRTPRISCCPPSRSRSACSGILVRLTRTSVLDALARGLRAHGDAPRARADTGARGHVLRNALPPIVTVVGLQAGALLAGAVITETIFAWPGLGRLLVQAIDARDYPLVQGCVLAIGVSYVVVNASTDILQAVLDPRRRDA